MKKRRLLGLALLAPLGLLAGCGGTMTLGFSPNWYYDNTVENITGKSERLEYEVTFRASQLEGMGVAYDTGSYVTELTAEDCEQGGKLVQTYRFHSEFNITGRYLRGSEEGEQFDDSMVSDVWFMKASEGLRPVKSEKTVHSTVPYSEQGSSAWYTTYEFTYNIDYAEDLSSADYTLNITAPASRQRESTGNIELGYDETFLDNEEIVFALRGLNLSSASAAYPFVTIDPQTQRPVTVNLSTETQTTAVAFELDGETVEESIGAVQVSCIYTSAQPGPTRRFVYAARTDDASKKYRGVLLRFENTVMYSLGTMTYTLKKATFNDR